MGSFRTDILLAALMVLNCCLAGRIARESSAAASSGGSGIAVRAYPPALSLSEGQRGIFYCESDDVSVGVEWTRKQGQISTQSSKVEKGKLLLFGLKAEDSGEYVCTASKDNVVSKVSVTLTVIPENMSRSGDDGTVEIQIVRKKVTAHTAVELHCETLGGAGSVTWAKMDEVLPVGAEERNGVLHFADVQLTDAGFYECKSGSAGSDVPQNVVQLIVKPDPVPVSIMAVPSVPRAAVQDPQIAALEAQMKNLREQLATKTRELQTLRSGSKVA